jgi:mRNA interferase RelE/StbE
MADKSYEIRITPAAQKELERIPGKSRGRVEVAIVALAAEPRPPGSIKLRGLESTYRIRVGNYRVLYQVYDDELVVLVVKLGDRKDVYRD